MTMPLAPARALPRPVRTTTLAALLAALLTLLAAPAASAHDVLTSSDPADGATLAAPPARIALTFDEAPTAGTAVITVVGPDGTSRYEQGPVTEAGPVISVGVAPLGPAGRYEVGYRVVSDDGHPVSGALSFTLTTPGPAAVAASSGAPAAVPASASPAAAASSPSPAAPDDGGVPAWPFVVLAVVVVGGALALVLRRRT